MNVMYGVITGIGTIDRLKGDYGDDEPVPLQDIFGIQGYWTWPLPIDPIFQDYDKVMGYSTSQRLLREDKLFGGDQISTSGGGGTVGNPGTVLEESQRSSLESLSTGTGLGLSQA